MERLGRAYFEALKTTGTSVAFTGIPLKFQADMGVLLALIALLPSRK